MDLPESLVVIRNILLVQIVVIMAMPASCVCARGELLKIWRSIKSPFLVQKKIRKKRGAFWEIDLTQIEP